MITSKTPKLDLHGEEVAIVYSLVKEFNSGAKVARYFGISSAYINNCIKHNRLYKGFKIVQKNKEC